MKMLGFVLIFALVAAGLIALSANDPAVSGVPATGSGPGLMALLAPNPGAYDAQADSYRALADLSAQKAQEARAWSAAATQAQRDQILAATQAAADYAQSATQSVESTRTQQAFAATLEASQAKATAEMKIIETQAALEVAQQQVTATFTELKLQVAQGQATKQAREMQRAEAWEQVKFDVAYNTRFVWVNWWLILLGLLFAGAFGAGYELLRQRAAVNMKTVPVSPDGTHELVVMGGKIHNADHSTTATIDPRKVIPDASADQLQITRLHQAVRAINGLTRGGYRRQAYQAAEQIAQQAAGIIPSSGQMPHEETLPDVAPWDLTGWSGRTLPLGIGSGNTGIELDPQKTPNLVIASTSNGGKTMRALRPITAAALASGWQVLVANTKAGDFAPLVHPNLVMVQGEAVEVAEMLDAVTHEVKRRNDILAEYGISTYYRMGNAEQMIGPRLMIVIDELVSLIYGAPNETRNRIWRTSIQITSKCRAMGIMMVLAGTDITYRLGKDWLAVRANCGRMAFRMLDMDMSRALLDIKGAEDLTGAQFIARLDGDPVRGVAFHPEDEDIRRFLNSHKVPTLPPPPFLLSSSQPVETTAPVVQVEAQEPQEDPAIAELAEMIRPVWEQKGSGWSCARAAGMEYAGAGYHKIKRAIEYLEKQRETTTTTTTEPQDGVEGQVEAE